MKKPITPGTLCLLVNAEALSGRIVTAETPIPAHHAFILKTNMRTLYVATHEPAWWCLFQRPVTVGYEDGKPIVTDRFVVPTRCLVPLSDPDAQLTDEKEKEHV